MTSHVRSALWTLCMYIQVPFILFEAKWPGRSDTIPNLVFVICHKKNVFANFLSHKKPILEMTTQSILLTRQFKQN